MASVGLTEKDAKRSGLNTSSARKLLWEGHIVFICCLIDIFQGTAAMWVSDGWSILVI
jgi:hypothetical protein